MEINEITGKIVDACVRIHESLGPGLLESVYEKVLTIELEKRGLKAECQKPLSLTYEGVCVEDAYRIDMLVQDEVLVELKSTNIMHPVYAKQLKTYLVLSKKQVGILANFGMPTMKEGLKRIVNNYVGSTPSALSASPREGEGRFARGGAECAEM